MTTRTERPLNRSSTGMPAMTRLQGFTTSRQQSLSRCVQPEVPLEAVAQSTLEGPSSPKRGRRTGSGARDAACNVAKHISHPSQETPGPRPQGGLALEAGVCGQSATKQSAGKKGAHAEQ